MAQSMWQLIVAMPAPKLHPLTDLPNKVYHAVIPILAPSIQAVTCQQAPPRTWAIEALQSSSKLTGR
jgi:hypothetical protein